MKHNGTQGTYHSVPQNLQNEEIEESKKVPSHESVVENGQNVKTSPTPSKELQEDGTEDEKKPMSPLRKFCFVLSLLQCVLFIVAFGWLIPCKIPRHSDQSHYAQNWELNFYGEDFVTNLAITGSEQKPVVVVFGFSPLSNISVFGIRAVNAFDGSSMWEVDMITKPVDIICDSVDVNSDRVPDCIVTDDAGKMFAVSAVDGKTIWYMHEHPQYSIQPQSISKPILGHSCHGESMPYIYTAVQDKSDSYYFVIVSGLTGEILKIHNLPECTFMPKNMMWRKGKTDPDEMEPPQELVMSCTNKAGNWIIYNINIEDFCKNSTSQSFNEVFFKLDIIDGIQDSLRLTLINTNDGENVASLTQDRVKVYSDEKDERAQYLAESGVALKDFVVGHFTNNSLANIVVLSRSDSTKLDSISLLDNTNSRTLWNTVIVNVTATAVYTFHNALNSLDTVLLKVVSETSEIHPDHINETDTALADFIHFEEKYLVLECSDTGSFKTVTHDLTMATCQDGICKPDAFTDKHTALLADIDNDEKEELIYFTRKTLPSTLVQSISLKLVRLSEPQSSATCSSCHC